MWKTVFLLLVVPIASTGSWIDDPSVRRAALAKRPVPAPVFTMNLDLPPKDRWTTILSHPMFKNCGRDMQAYIDHMVPKTLIPVIDGLAKHIEGYFPKHYGEEMESIANTLNIPLGIIVLVNLEYSLQNLLIHKRCFLMNTTGPCPKRQPGAFTSFVAEDQDGTIWHGRNLDFNLAPVVRQYTMDIDFQRGGKTIYSGTTLPGSVGVLHGYRHGGFSLSLNARDEGGESILDMLQLMFKTGVRTATHLMRDSLETQLDFDAGLHMLSTAPIAQHAYFILGGIKAGQGAVIARDRDSAHYVAHLNETGTGNTQPWWLLQTNYDRSVTPPVWDDRQGVGDAHMEALGQGGLNEAGVERVLRQWPTMNHRTDVSAVINTAKGTYHSFIMSETESLLLIV